MELIRSLHNIRERHRGCVATIGNFDGIHLGHQAIIAQLKEAGKVHNLPTVVVTFEPQPQEYFMSEKAPARVLRLREKIESLRQQKIDRMVCLRFNNSLANLSPEEFIEKLLVDGLAIRYLVVGDDFHFGKDRKGDYSLLQTLGKQYGFDVVCTTTSTIQGRRVSSTWLREVLAAGKLELAQRLLGRHYSISGRIVHGDKRGRRLGFPTANVDMHRLISPVSGIFATKVYGLNDAGIDAVTNIGTRPMFGGKVMILEAHLLDFDDDIYGRYVRVELLKQLRREETFATIEELKQQMQNDVENTKEFFRENNNKVI